MIDIENKVIDTVKKAVIAFSPDTVVYSEYIDVPSSFPCVTVMETDNVSTPVSMDDELLDHHAYVTYEINVYTNDSTMRKARAKAIANRVDAAMLGMKFTRNALIPTPNIEHTIYRITMRYTAVVSDGVESDSTTTFQMYRKI